MIHPTQIISDLLEVVENLSFHMSFDLIGDGVVAVVVVVVVVFYCIQVVVDKYAFDYFEIGMKLNQAKSHRSYFVHYQDSVDYYYCCCCYFHF
jgi:hypothetical protein